MSTVEIGTPREGRPVLTSRQRWIDLFFVLALCLWHPLISSIYLASHGPKVYQPGRSDFQVFSGVLYELSGLAVLIYVLYRRNSNLRFFGCSPQWKDIVRAVPLCLVQVVAMFVVGFTYAITCLAVTGHYPARVSAAELLGIRASLAWLTYLTINPWFEELILRGFLMTELSALVSVPVAVIVSTVIQTSGHVYQGAFNMLMLGGAFLVSSLYYARTRRLLPVILAHLIIDLLPLARIVFHR